MNNETRVMTPSCWSGPRWTLWRGEALTVLRAMGDGTVDAVVQDPPAGIKFMAADWDTDHGGRTAWINAHAPIFAECLRVAKPGAFGVVWAYPRTAHYTMTALEDAGWEIRDLVAHIQGQGKPSTPDRLKPAFEPWVLVRKPGGDQKLNIEACRIGTSKRVPSSVSRTHGTVYSAGLRNETGDEPGHNTNAGRHPANLTLDEDAAAELDAQVGERTSGARRAGVRKGMGYHGASGDGGPAIEANTGGPSRYFYVAKAKGVERVGHPTQKSIALMEYLVRLACPPEGLVLDCFAGSCTTGVAALRQGMRFVGIEREREYVEIGLPRLRAETT